MRFAKFLFLPLIAALVACNGNNTEKSTGQSAPDFEDAIEYFEDYIKFDIPQEEKDSVNKLIERIRAKVSN